jgi:hypothetical protein
LRDFLPKQKQNKQTFLKELFDKGWSKRASNISSVVRFEVSILCESAMKTISDEIYLSNNVLLDEYDFLLSSLLLSSLSKLKIIGLGFTINGKKDEEL